MNPTLCFIGAGNMAGSLIGGWCTQCEQAGETAKVRVADPSQEQLDTLASKFPVTTHHANNKAVSGADVVIIAVKPDKVSAVCQEIAEGLSTDALVVSVAAGVRLQDIERWLNGEQSEKNAVTGRALVRCMPNTPALLGAGITGLYAAQSCTQAHSQLAERVLKSAGETVWVNEEQLLDVVTAVSGSGPAYFFYLIECMAAAGENMGLAGDDARKLAIETAYGAARMARESTEEPARLRQNVTSKGGTTAAALNSFEQNNFSQVVQLGMQAARERAVSLGDEFASD